MVSTAVSVLAPLAFVVVLELAQLARDVPILTETGETEQIDYEFAAESGDRPFHSIARRVPFVTGLLSGGGFYVLFVLTELVLYGSVLVVYGASGPVLTTPGLQLVPIGILAFLSLVWLLLPVVVIRRYDDLVRNGVEPFSKNVHVTTTAAYILVIVAFAELPDMLGVRPPNVVLGFVTGIGAALIGSKKWQLFWRHLRMELAQLERPERSVDDGQQEAVTTDTGSAGEKPSDGQ